MLRSTLRVSVWSYLLAIEPFGVGGVFDLTNSKKPLPIWEGLFGQSVSSRNSRMRSSW